MNFNLSSIESTLIHNFGNILSRPLATKAPIIPPPIIVKSYMNFSSLHSDIKKTTIRPFLIGLIVVAILKFHISISYVSSFTHPIINHISDHSWKDKMHKENHE